MSVRASVVVVWAAATAFALAPIPSLADAAGAACPDATTVQPDDTLSRIAARCDVSEAAILAANSEIDSSGDLQVGTTVRVHPKAGSRFADSLNRYAQQANDALGRVAGRIGSSVEDLLDKNPDLKSRLDRLSTRMGLTEGRSVTPISVTPQELRPGSRVNLSATKLPKDTAVVVGAGPPGAAYRVLEAARTSAEGTLDLNVEVPEGLAPGSSVVFVVKGTDEVAARSARIALGR